MRGFFSSSALVFLLVAVTGVFPACSTSVDSEQDTTGSVWLSLTGTSFSGLQYRLRDTLIAVTGPTARVHDTESAPNLGQLSFTLPVGSYEVLVTGVDSPNSWRLVRLESDGTETEVEAELLSPNPQTAEVAPDGITGVFLRFIVGGEDVVFASGDLVIHINIEDRPRCTAFATPTGCASGQKCDPLNAEIAICTPAGTTPQGGACVLSSECLEGNCGFGDDGTTVCLDYCDPAAGPGDPGSCTNPAFDFCSQIFTLDGVPTGVGLCL
jgi:hypothetical protein